MDQLQNELDAEHSGLNIQLLGVNEFGHAQGNSLAVAGRDLPLLQDEDANHDGQSDVWERWDVEYRDLVIVNADMQEVGVISLTTYDLGNAANYAAAKEILVGVAQGKAFWRNSANPLDTSGDGFMSPVDDVLRLINEINSRQVIDEVGRLPLPMPPYKPAPFYDVNGDGFLSAAADILPVINYFNQPVGEGEAASTSRVLNVHRDAALDLPRVAFNGHSSFSPVTEFNDDLTEIRSTDYKGITVGSLFNREVEFNTESQNDRGSFELSRIWKVAPTELLSLLEDDWSPITGP